jgi:hypothetical protein
MTLILFRCKWWHNKNLNSLRRKNFRSRRSTNISLRAAAQTWCDPPPPYTPDIALWDTLWVRKLYAIWWCENNWTQQNGGTWRFQRILELLPAHINTMKQVPTCEIWGYPGGNDRDYGLLGCNGVKWIRFYQTTRRHISAHHNFEMCTGWRTFWRWLISHPYMHASVMKMEAAASSKTLVHTYQTIRRHLRIP